MLAKKIYNIFKELNWNLEILMAKKIHNIFKELNWIAAMTTCPQTLTYSMMTLELKMGDSFSDISLTTFNKFSY